MISVIYGKILFNIYICVHLQYTFLFYHMFIYLLISWCNLLVVEFVYMYHKNKSFIMKVGFQLLYSIDVYLIILHIRDIYMQYFSQNYDNMICCQFDS